MKSTQKMRNNKKRFSNKTFRDCVLEAVAAIPAGETRTYREIAIAAGNPRAARAVGNILNANTSPGVPCHRVVRSDGRLGGYNQGKKKKEKLLQQEGAVESRENTE